MEKRWNLLYDRIVFRHLEIERTDEFINNLEIFIKARYSYLNRVVCNREEILSDCIKIVEKEFSR